MLPSFIYLFDECPADADACKVANVKQQIRKSSAEKHVIAGRKE